MAESTYESGWSRIWRGAKIRRSPFSWLVLICLLGGALDLSGGAHLLGGEAASAWPLGLFIGLLGLFGIRGDRWAFLLMAPLFLLLGYHFGQKEKHSHLRQNFENQTQEVFIPSTFGLMAPFLLSLGAVWLAFHRTEARARAADRLIGLRFELEHPELGAASDEPSRSAGVVEQEIRDASGRLRWVLLRLDRALHGPEGQVDRILLRQHYPERRIGDAGEIPVELFRLARGQEVEAARAEAESSHRLDRGECEREVAAPIG